MSNLNEIYKKQYLKSVGKDDASLKRKRQESLEYLDDYIEDMKNLVMEEGRRGKFDTWKLFNEATHEYREKKRARAKSMVMKNLGSYLNEHELTNYDLFLKQGMPTDQILCTGIQKALPDAEKELSEELGTEDEYVESHVTENAHVKVPLGIIMAIRDLLQTE